MEQPAISAPAEPFPDLGLPVRFAAGCAAGVRGFGLASLWFVFHSLLWGEPWWAKFNLAAAPFFGDRVFRMGLSRATLAGASHLTVVYGVLGGLCGLLITTRLLRRHALLVSVCCGLLWTFLGERVFWSHLHVFAAAYYPRGVLLTANLLFALALWRTPPLAVRLHEIVARRRDESPSPPAPDPPAASPAGAPDC
jgi:hypothetical protein